MRKCLFLKIFDSWFLKIFLMRPENDRSVHCSVTTVHRNANENGTRVLVRYLLFTVNLRRSMKSTKRAWSACALRHLHTKFSTAAVQLYLYLCCTKGYYCILYGYHAVYRILYSVLIFILVLVTHVHSVLNLNI